MARQLLAGAPVVYNGDPLRDLSLVNFLDAFVQRKPKVCDPPAAHLLFKPLKILQQAAHVDGQVRACCARPAAQVFSVGIQLLLCCGLLLTTC